MSSMNTSQHALNKVLSSVPSEMLYEIFSNLPFKELQNILVLNRDIYSLLIESEFFFRKLCSIYCIVNNIELSDFEKVVENVKKRNTTSISSGVSGGAVGKNMYFDVLNECIQYFGYSWDTDFPYYSATANNKYELTSTTLKTIDKPQHGEFYTVKARKLLNPGKLYKWKIELNEYCLDTSNSFVVMIGIESLGFFPFNDQSSGDVIGWKSNSKGIALVTGTAEIIQGRFTGFEFTETDFKAGDIIQVEFDFSHVPLDVQPFPPTGKYSEIIQQKEGSVRFCVIRNGMETELRTWTPFGDVRFAPYVPAISVNKYQTVSFTH